MGIGFLFSNPLSGPAREIRPLLWIKRWGVFKGPALSRALLSCPYKTTVCSLTFPQMGGGDGDGGEGNCGWWWYGSIVRSSLPWQNSIVLTHPLLFFISIGRNVRLTFLEWNKKETKNQNFQADFFIFCNYISMFTEEEYFLSVSCFMLIMLSSWGN